MLVSSGKLLLDKCLLRVYNDAIDKQIERYTAMTTQQHIAIKHIEEAHEAQRFEASQASREQAELDAVSVLYAVQAKLEQGLIDEAKAIVADYRASKRSN